MLLFNNLCTGYGMRMWLSLVLAWHVEGVGINTFWIGVDTNDIHKTGWSSKDKWNKLSFTHSIYPHSWASRMPLAHSTSTSGTKVVNWLPGHALSEQGPRPLTQPQMLPRALWGQLYFGSPQPQQCSSFTHAQLLWGQCQLLTLRSIRHVARSQRLKRTTT